MNKSTLEIDCPKCSKGACVHHMRCHHCNYRLRYTDVYGEDEK